MKIYPSQQFKIETKKPKDKVIKDLTEATLLKADAYKFRLSNKGKYFRGEIDNEYFCLVPHGIKHGKSMYRPVFVGKVTEEDEVTILEGTAETGDTIKMVFPLTIVLFLVFVISAYEGFSFFIPLALVMFGLNFLLIHVYFESGVKRAIKDLKQIVGAPEDDEYVELY